MAETQQDFTIWAGNDVVIRIDVEMNEDQVLLGADIRWWLAPTKWSTDRVLIRKRLGDGIEMDPDDQTAFLVSLDAADTEGMHGCYYHEAEVIETNSKVSTVTTGTVTIRPTIIQADGDS